VAFTSLKKHIAIPSRHEPF